jgi:hypothetical protein
VPTPATSSSPIPTAGRPGHHPADATRAGLALAGADGPGPRRLVQLGLAGQRRSTKRGPHRGPLAAPGSGPASGPGAQGPDQLVDRGGPGTGPHPGATGELRVAHRPGLRSAVRSRPWAWVEGVWGFHLRPAPGGRTRLVARTRNRSRPRCWPDRAACCWGSCCISACRPANSTTWALVSAWRRSWAGIVAEALKGREEVSTRPVAPLEAGTPRTVNRRSRATRDAHRHSTVAPKRAGRRSASGRRRCRSPRRGGRPTALPAAGLYRRTTGMAVEDRSSLQ